MKTIGLLGGMSWESTVPYYRIINQVIGERLGGLHSAKIVLVSVDFQEIEVLQHHGRWDEAAEILKEAAERLDAAGAEILVLCTNTMHKVAAGITGRIPLLHIADATAREIRAAGLGRIGLLGSRFTMEEGFYRGRLEKEHGLDVVLPGETDRELVHRVIYEELCRGIIREASRKEYRRVISGLVERGAEGVILGCTEIGLLIGPRDVDVAVFDTTEIHARAAAEWALEPNRKIS
jgi:aspartate racemase